MKKTFHFLAGLPRSGSTVLAAILNQNPETHVSATSGLVDALGSLVTIWGKTPVLNQNDPDNKKLVRIMRGIVNDFYDVPEPIIIDKSRSWAVALIIEIMSTVLERDLKIIATVRSIPDCAASFVRVAKPEYLGEFIYSGLLIDSLKKSYIWLHDGYIAMPECFLFVEYEDLVANPEIELKRIHKFLGLNTFEYNFNSIEVHTVKENDDELYGHAGLHDIKPKLEKQHNEDPKDVLGDFYSSFSNPEFWRSQ